MKSKTRKQKDKAEIKRLQEENAKMRLKYIELENEVNKIIEESRAICLSTNRVQEVIIYFVDVLISALILLFVYWITIFEYENFDIPYYAMLILDVLVVVKIVYQKSMTRVIVVDLLKPFLGMVVGLALCILCLGEYWREAYGYALDTANMGVLLFMVTLACVIHVSVCCVVIYTYKKVKTKIHK